MLSCAAWAVASPDRGWADAYPMVPADPYPLPNPGFRPVTRDQLVPRTPHAARPASEVQKQWGVLAKLAGTRWALDDDEVISIEWGEYGYSMLVTTLGLFGDSSVSIVRQDSDGRLETHATSDWSPGDAGGTLVADVDHFAFRIDPFNLEDCLLKGKALTCRDPFDRGPDPNRLPTWHQVDAAQAQAILAKMPNDRLRYPPLTRAKTNLAMGSLRWTQGTWINFVGNAAHKLSVRVADNQLQLSSFDADETVEYHDNFVFPQGGRMESAPLATARNFAYVGQNGSEVFEEKSLTLRGPFYSNVCAPDTCTTYIPGIDGSTMLALRQVRQGKGKAAHWAAAPRITYYRIDRPIGPDWGALNYLQQVGLLMKPSSGQAVEAHYWLFDYDPHGETLVGRDVDSRGRPSGARIDVARTKTPATFRFAKFEPGAARPSMTGTLVNYDEASFDWYNDSTTAGAPARPIMRVVLYGGSGKAYRIMRDTPQGMLRTGDVFPNVALVDRAQIAGTAIAIRADDRRQSDRAILAHNEVVRAENLRIEAANRAARASRPSLWDSLLAGLYQGLGGNGGTVTSNAWTANGGGPTVASRGYDPNEVIGPYGVTVGETRRQMLLHPSASSSAAPADNGGDASGSSGAASEPAAETPKPAYTNSYVSTPSKPRSVSIAMPPPRPVYPTQEIDGRAYAYGLTNPMQYEGRWMPVSSAFGLNVSVMFRHELADQVIAQIRVENTNRYAVIVGITPEYRCFGQGSKKAMTAMTLTLGPSTAANGQNAGLHDYPCPGAQPPVEAGFRSLSVKRVD